MKKMERLYRLPKRIFGRLSKCIHATGDLTIITGANAPFYESMRDNLLSSVFRYEPQAQVIIWDLGLNNMQNVEIQRIIESTEGGKLLKYPEETLPEFYAMARYNYAFKSYCIFHSLPLVKTKYAMWLDAGCGLRGHLDAERNMLQFYGYYSPYSSTSIGKLTYETVMNSFLDWKMEYANKQMLSGGVQGWDMGNKEAIALLCDWYNLSRVEENIEPSGASLQNHRYDQSLLSIVYYSRHKEVPYLERHTYNIGVHLNR
ncbi:MAG: hypothetical protein IKO23_02900 [Bacteroidales bacterium]|nr:hypothetical protein [Bacteroidales bacterium]